MFGWEGRILDNKSILVIKAALPFLDIPVGETIDLEGLLRAVRGYCREREKQWIDMFLNFFMLKRAFSMMSVMNEMTAAQESDGGGMEQMLDLLKSQIPKEQQEMFDMMSMMMLAAGGAFSEASDNASNEADVSEHAEKEEIPEIWRDIARESKEEILDDRPQ